jgi:hypothetical protein
MAFQLPIPDNMRVGMIFMGMIGLYLLPLCLRAQSKPVSPLDSNYFQINQKSAFDSSYYKTFPKNLTIRAFISRKYNRLLVSEPAGILTYRPNTPPNLGLGVTYRFITLNLSAGLGFFDPQEKGKTHYFDLQSHLYWRTVTVDVFGQFYRGYYISPKSLNKQQDSNYVRPDVKVNLVGIAANYVFNFRRFSYRSSLVQDEWQQKSAGSLLAGWATYYGNVLGDSSIAPKSITSDSSGKAIHGAHFFEMGPSLGYVYTLVFKEHYFLTANASLQAALGYTREYGNGIYNRFGVTPNITYRAVAGYNGGVWGVNVSWLNNQVAVIGVNSNEAYRVKSGIYQFTVSRHFGLSAKVRRKMNAVQDKIKGVITPIGH